MENGSWWWHLIEKIFGACVLLAISAYLIKCAIGWLYQIRFALLIIAALVILIIIGIRIYRFKKSQEWRDDDEAL